MAASQLQLSAVSLRVPVHFLGPVLAILESQREALDTVFEQSTRTPSKQYGVSLHNPACPSWDLSNSPPAHNPGEDGARVQRKDSSIPHSLRCWNCAKQYLPTLEETNE